MDVLQQPLRAGATPLELEGWMTTRGPIGTVYVQSLFDDDEPKSDPGPFQGCAGHHRQPATATRDLPGWGRTGCSQL
jgi:hypothetical protein